MPYAHGAPGQASVSSLVHPATIKRSREIETSSVGPMHAVAKQIGH
jgi:hypothetical protein